MGHEQQNSEVAHFPLNMKVSFSAVNIIVAVKSAHFQTENACALYRAKAKSGNLFVSFMNHEMFPATVEIGINNRCDSSQLKKDRKWTHEVG